MLVVYIILLGDYASLKVKEVLMREWLQEAIRSCSLPEYAEGYVLGRGLPWNLVEELGVCIWQAQPTRAPDKFYHNNGVKGHRVHDWLCIPLYSPRGRLVGCEYRNLEKKEVRKYHMQESNWVPVFGGMCPTNLDKIASGSDVWLVEGIFDIALQKAVSEKDVVLSMGGAKVTPHQINFLKRFVRKTATVHVCFDMDETGRKMAQGYTHPDTGKKIWGVVQRLERVKLNARLVTYTGGKDPGEIWESGGAFALKQSLKLYT